MLYEVITTDSPEMVIDYRIYTPARKPTAAVVEKQCVGIDILFTPLLPPELEVTPDGA